MTEEPRTVTKNAKILANVRELSGYVAVHSTTKAINETLGFVPDIRAVELNFVRIGGGYEGKIVQEQHGLESNRPMNGCCYSGDIANGDVALTKNEQLKIVR